MEDLRALAAGRSVRIAIATDWFAPRRGGVESQLTCLVEGLTARGHEVDVLTAMPGAHGGGHFRLRQLQAQLLPGSPLALSPALPRLLRHELGRGYDVVHAHVSVVSPVGYTAALQARALGLPTVATFHSVLRAKTHVLRAVNAVADLAGSATHWTGVSALVASQLRRALGSRASVGVLPNGIDVRFWRAAREGTPAPTAGGEPGITVVYAGRLHRKKRPRELVHAFARASALCRPAATLVLVGDGPERASIERDITLLGLRDGTAARVVVREWLSPDDLRAVYAKADAFASAAIRESFGIAALEASAAGLPVIAMTRAGSSEFLRHERGALLCRDDADLARQLARFMTDDVLRAGMTADGTPADRYDWSTVLDEHEAAYRLAMTRANRAAASAVG